MYELEPDPVRIAAVSSQLSLQVGMMVDGATPSLDVLPRLRTAIPKDSLGTSTTQAALNSILKITLLSETVAKSLAAVRRGLVEMFVASRVSSRVGS